MSDTRTEEIILEVKRDVLEQMVIACFKAIDEWEHADHDRAKAWAVVTDKMHDWLLQKKELEIQFERVEELRGVEI